MVSRKRKRIVRRLAPAFVLAGGAVGASVMGSALPGDTGAGLQNASSGFAGFVGPAATVGGAMIVVDSLQDLRKKKKRRRR